MASHKRSRAGCDRCKQRRVRCDEKKPQCTACARRRELCGYSVSRTAAPAAALDDDDDESEESSDFALVKASALLNDLTSARQSLLYYQRYMLPWRTQGLSNPWWKLAEISFSGPSEPAIDALLAAKGLACLSRYGMQHPEGPVAYFRLMDFGVRRIVRHGNEMPFASLIWSCLLLGAAEMGRTADPTMLLKHCRGCIKLLEAEPAQDESAEMLEVRRTLPATLRAVIFLADEASRIPVRRLIGAGQLADGGPLIQPAGFMTFEAAAAHLKNLISTSVVPLAAHFRQDWIAAVNPNVVAPYLARWRHDFEDMARRTLLPAAAIWKPAFFRMHYAAAQAIVLGAYPVVDHAAVAEVLASAVEECTAVVEQLQLHGQPLTSPFEQYGVLGLLQPLYMAGLHMNNDAGHAARLMLLSLNLTEGNWSSFAALRAIRDQSRGELALSEESSFLDRTMRDVDAGSTEKTKISTRAEDDETILRTYGYVRHGAMPALFLPCDGAIEDVKAQQQDSQAVSR